MANGEVCVSVNVSIGYAVLTNAPHANNWVNIQDWCNQQSNSFVGFFFSSVTV